MRLGEEFCWEYVGILKAYDVLPNELSLRLCSGPAGHVAAVTGFTRWSVGLGLFSGARVIRGAAASPSPQRVVSVRESVSCPSLDLLTNTQVLDEAKQMAVSSCSGGCIRCCLTESISGEEIFRSDQRFLLQNICSSLERPMTNPAIVK